MMQIDAAQIHVGMLDKHNHMCHLAYLDGPILSLFCGGKQNWLYLWCDTDAMSKERWLLFPVARKPLVQYLEKKETLRTLVETAAAHLILDCTHQEAIADPQATRGGSRRLLWKVDGLSQLSAYLPSADSFFDESLAPDVSLARELSPTLFGVPIDGDWFVDDLNRFSNVYAQLYAFFYCTKPQFMLDIGNKVQRYLHAPWKGGYSRVNLFDALEKMVPSIHDLQIKQMRYASPGEIKIEALASVHGSIESTVLHYLRNEGPLRQAATSLNAFLGSANLKKTDLSSEDDSQLALSQAEVGFIKETAGAISTLLAIEPAMSDLASHAPNIIVFSKVLLALVGRVQRLAEFQHAGLLALGRDAE